MSNGFTIAGVTFSSNMTRAQFNGQLGGKDQATQKAAIQAFAQVDKNGNNILDRNEIDIIKQSFESAKNTGKRDFNALQKVGLALEGIGTVGLVTTSETGIGFVASGCVWLLGAGLHALGGL